MNKYFKKVIILSCLIIFLVVPFFANAALPSEKLKVVGEGSYTTADEKTLAKIIGTVIQAFLGVLGVVFLALMVYAGYLWMTARGEEEKVTKAKDTIMRAVIGLIIVIGSYAITYFVVENLVISSSVFK